MIVVRDFDRLKEKELVATIGFFDGVHLGHRFLIDEMKEIAKARNLPSAVITFVPDNVIASVYSCAVQSSPGTYALIQESGVFIDKPLFCRYLRL